MRNPTALQFKRGCASNQGEVHLSWFVIEFSDATRTQHDTLVFESQQTYIRFRWSTEKNLDSKTAAHDGEVEDYAVRMQGGDQLMLSSVPLLHIRFGKCQTLKM